MESERSWEEQNALMNELVEGMEIAKKLNEELNLNLPSSSDTTRDSLLQRILSCYDKALHILRWNNAEEHQGELKHNPKKRKRREECIDHVRVKIENGVEGPKEDGYKWRKYGQKDILGAKYRRSYYRCTFRNTKGCCATKQEQRSDEDPTVFDITYRGCHTCCKGKDVVLPPESQDMHGHSYCSDIQQELFSQTNMISPSFHIHESDAAGSSFDFNFSLGAVGIDSDFPFDAFF